jgi:hypothetical protein
MQSVYDVYHHFCILLQDDLRLLHSFTNGSTDVVAENGCRVYCSAHIRYRKPSDKTNGGNIATERV